jgi:methionyl-tRNA formyltransferase
LKDETFLSELKELGADLQIVVAFRMLPEVVWNMPNYGTFNLHGSILPQYRGAAPINWAIINGENETGVTTFFLTHEIDTGKVIRQEKTIISESDNAGTVHDRLMDIGAKLVRETVDLLIDGKIDAIDQEHFIRPNETLKLAPKIFKETCEIDFSKSIEEVYNFVRGMSPYPTAWAMVQLPGQLHPTVLKIYEVEKEPAQHDMPVGAVVSDGKKFAKIAVADGFIGLKTVQLAGKRRMEIGELLRGLNNIFKHKDTK